MPDLEDLTDVEHRFLVELLTRLRRLDPWTRGHFAEALVASALPGSLLSTHSAAPHDIEWSIDGHPVTIAVRCTGSHSMDHRPGDGRRPFAGVWKFPRAKQAWDDKTLAFVEHDGVIATRRCWADVVVLCHHDGFEILDGWTFYVLDQSSVEDWEAETIRPSALQAHGQTAVALADLAPAVIDAMAGRRTS